MKSIDHATEKAVRRFLALLSDRYDMAGAILYGSRARGLNDADSDADVAVILKGERQRLVGTAFAMADVAYDVMLETGINVSPCRYGSMNGSIHKGIPTQLC